MTIDEQLRELAERAEQHQAVITADEVVRRAAGHEPAARPEHPRYDDRYGDGPASTRTGTADGLDTTNRRVPRWVLGAAAALVLVAIGLVAVGVGEDPESGRIETAASTPPPVADIPPGSIVFAADSAAGEELADPVDYRTVETSPNPMDLYDTSPGAPTRRLIGTEAHERCPVFSPDGRRLAYVEAPTGGRSPAPSIVVVPLDEAGNLGAPELRVRLPASDAYEVKLTIGAPCPQWSPDGRQLAYLTYPVDLRYVLWRDPVADLRVVTLDGQERVVNAGRPAFADGAFAWSPDGDAIAFPSAHGLWSASLDGRDPVLVWRADDTPTSDSWPMAVTWSSRDELAVTALTDEYDRGTIHESRATHVVDPATGDDVASHALHPYDYVASWSPDGAQFAMVDDDGHVRVGDPDDGSTARLSPRRADGREYLFWDVAWSPDGERLLALARSDRGFALVSLSTDGTSAETVTPWTWGLDWINLGDVSWQRTTD